MDEAHGNEPPTLIKSALHAARWTPFTEEEKEQSKDRILELNTLLKMFGLDSYIDYGKPGWPPLVIYLRRDENCSQHFYPPTLSQAEKIVQFILKSTALAPYQEEPQSLFLQLPQNQEH